MPHKRYEPLLLDTIFEKYRLFCLEKAIVRVDKYFFTGTRKIILEEDHILSLEETELKEIITESMDWIDAVIIQKKHNEGFVIAEGLIQKDPEKEEIVIRSIGSDLQAKSGLMRDVIDWFRKVSYPENMKDPFFVKVHHSGLDVFHYFDHE